MRVVSAKWGTSRSKLTTTRSRSDSHIFTRGGSVTAGGLFLHPNILSYRQMQLHLPLEVAMITVKAV